MNIKFFALLGFLFLSSTQFGFAQRETITKDVRALLKYSLTKFEAIKGDKVNSGGVWYKADKGLPSFNTRLLLQPTRKSYYSQSKTFVQKKLAQAGPSIKEFEREILAALPANYKSKSGLVKQMKAEVKSSGALLFSNSHVTCFYVPSERTTKPTNHPKLFLTWYSNDWNTAVEIYIVAPKNGKSIGKPRPIVASTTTKRARPITKKTTAVKSNTLKISDVVGTYIGFRTGMTSFKRATDANYKIVVNKNYTATFSVEKKGKWLELFNTTVKKVNFRTNKGRVNVYHFKTADKNFGDLRILIPKPNALFSNEYTSISIKEGKTFFRMKRNDGPPTYIITK